MTRTQLIRALALALLIAMPGKNPAEAGETKAGDLTIADPWARPNLPNRPTAGYLTIANVGETPDRLVAAHSPAFGRIEIHISEKKGDTVTMARVEDIPVAAEGTAELAPGGLHLMLFDAETLMKAGESFPLTLEFETAGAVEITVQVRKPSLEELGHGSGYGGHSGHGTTN